MTAHIDATLGGIEAKLQDAETQFGGATTAEQQEYIKRARLLHGYARFMHKSVPWVSYAATPCLALGALYFIDEIGAIVCGRKPDAVPVAGGDFSTERWPFRDLYQPLGLPAPSGAIPVILNLPALEVATHLLLPLHGHELGHTAVAEQQLAGQVIQAETTALSVGFNAARTSVAQVTQTTEREAGVMLGWQLERWTTELLCDQFGIQALGPSFLYAFASYMLGDSWDKPGDRHPPTNLRLAHVIDYLDAAGWSAVVDTHTPATLRWLRTVAATTPQGGDAATDFLITAMSTIRSSVRQAVSAALATGVYTPTAFSADWAGVEELVAHETLPVQKPNGQPFDRRSIMIAAWLSALVGADRPATLSTAPADVRSQAFFARALEMSAVLTHWQRL